MGEKKANNFFFPSRKQTQTFEQRGHREAKQLVVSSSPTHTNTTSSSFWRGGCPQHCQGTPLVRHRPLGWAMHLLPAASGHFTSSPALQVASWEITPRHFWRCPQGDAGDEGDFGGAGGTPAVPPALPGTQHTLTHICISLLVPPQQEWRHQGWIKDQAIYY